MKAAAGSTIVRTERLKWDLAAIPPLLLLLLICIIARRSCGGWNIKILPQKKEKTSRNFKQQSQTDQISFSVCNQYVPHLLRQNRQNVDIRTWSWRTSPPNWIQTSPAQTWQKSLWGRMEVSHRAYRVPSVRVSWTAAPPPRILQQLSSFFEPERRRRQQQQPAAAAAAGSDLTRNFRNS